MKQNITLFQRLTYLLIITVLGYIVLTEAKHIFQPIALALLFSYLLFPIVNLFENKWKLSRGFSIILALLTGLILVSIVVNLIIMQISVIIKDFPAIKHQTVENLKSWQVFIENKLHITVEAQEKWLQQKLTQLLDQSGKILSKVAKSSFGTIETIIFIPIFAFFMLLYRDRGREFVLKLAKERNNKLTNKLLDEIGKVTIKYLVGVATVVTILAISHSIALLAIGLKYAIPIALITALFSFIPYFGTLVSGVIPFTLSLLISDNPYQPLFIAIYFFVITFIDHNILTPTITGGNVSLNPLATIIGLLIAGFVWGITGMIIIVPLLATFKTICDRVPGLEPYGYIIGIEHHGVDIKTVLSKAKKKKNK